MAVYIFTDPKIFFKRFNLLKIIYSPVTKLVLYLSELSCLAHDIKMKKGSVVLEMNVEKCLGLSRDQVRLLLQRHVRHPVVVRGRGEEGGRAAAR